MKKCNCINEAEKKEKIVEEKSFAMTMVTEYSKLSKKLIIIIFTLLVIVFAEPCIFTWYLNQYDFISESETSTIEQGTDSTGTINNYGDITNGVSKNNND
ncbi:MAG: hypothetical protein HFE51_05075 [Clostridia bacterium]|nr:hypothetical protein [Clostridia bacterium]